MILAQLEKNIKDMILSQYRAQKNTIKEINNKSIKVIELNKLIVIECDIKMNCIPRKIER